MRFSVEKDQTMHDGGWWSFIRYDEKQDRPQVSWALVRRAAAYGRPYAGKIALMLALILAITLLNLIPPLLTRNLIDYALPQGDVGRLTLLALGMIAVARTQRAARRGPALPRARSSARG